MIKRYLGHYKWYVTFAVLLVMIQSFSVLYQPQLTSDIINELSNVNIDQNYVNQLGIELILVGIAGLIAGIINTFLAAKLSQSIGADIREDGFRTIQKLAFQDIEKFTTSNLVVRLTNDITQVQNALMLGIQMLLRVPFLFVGAFILSVTALPQLWWTIILYVIIVVLISGVVFGFMGPKFKSIQNSVDKINTTVKENLDGVRVVKSFGTEKDEKAKFDEKVVKLTNDYKSVGIMFATMIPVFMFTANILIAFAIFFVGNHAVDDPDLIGSVVSFMSYVMQLMFAIMMGGFLSMTLSRAGVSTRRISEVLNAKTTIAYGDDDFSTVDTVEFKNVDFAYGDEDEMSLNNISFSAKKGEKIGIVGATGSGKTTLVQLIPRLYDVSGGEILINGKNIKNFDEKSLRDNISMVLQKANLFSGTIKDNIQQGNRSASNLDIELAAKYSQAYEFIVNKENQFKGEVYQKGANFSGGQKQRLSIARGFIKNPEILILDDSTSALDARSENLVKEALNEEFQGILTFIVAQKISSVLDTDKIVVLDEGKVDAIGTHKELIEKSETYRKIYETQKGKGVVHAGK